MSDNWKKELKKTARKIGCHGLGILLLQEHVETLLAEQEKEVRRECAEIVMKAGEAGLAICGTGKNIPVKDVQALVGWVLNIVTNKIKGNKTKSEPLNF